MKSAVRLISRLTARIIPFRMLVKGYTPVFLPFYHVVNNRKLPHILNYPYRDESEFEKELDYFLKYFRPVSLADLVKNPFPDEKVFHISFDDGLRECAEVIAPILLKKGIPATFFINTGFVDNNDLFHRYKASLILSGMKKNLTKNVADFLDENNIKHRKILRMPFEKTHLLDKIAEMMEIDFQNFLEMEKPYLKIEQLRWLKNMGFVIGAHSENHAEFWMLSPEDQLNQVRKSMKWITQKINPEIRAFSFPFTDFGISNDLFNKIRDENICDVTFGTAGLKYDQAELHFQRYPVEQQGDFIVSLKSEFVYFYLRKLVGKDTVTH